MWNAASKVDFSFLGRFGVGGLRSSYFQRRREAKGGEVNGRRKKRRCLRFTL